MQEKFKYILLFTFLLIYFLYPAEKGKTISFVVNENEMLSNKSLIITKFLVDAAEEKINDMQKNISFKETNEIFDINNPIKISNFITANNLDAFYFIDVVEGKSNIQINLSLYTILPKPIFSKKLMINENDIIDNENFLTDNKINEWLEMVNESITLATMSKEKIFNVTTNKKIIGNDRDFPFINIVVSAVSSKISFDERAIYYSYKAFSFFPFDFRLSFYPAKYLETGLFFEINYDNLVVRYYDKDNDVYHFFDIGTILNYGAFLGASFFNQEKFHYSLGAQFYNLFYDLSRKPEWHKTIDAKSYFLPQFSFYQKIDINIIKFFYISLIFNLKTMPKFYLTNNYFYSQPFYYDFFYAEFSLIGVSIIF